MEINITSLLELDCFNLSHSRAEGGENAGRNTWNASKEQADETALLDTEEKLQAMRDFVKSSGGWSKEEIAAWSNQELNALFLQWVAGDVRQCSAILPGYTFKERIDSNSELTSDYVREWFYSTEDEPDMETGPFESRTEAYAQASDEYTGRPGTIYTADDLASIDWEETETRQQEGQCPSNLFKGIDGQIYFSLES